ncbi:hypothetical protein V2J09_001971 [Rumex salicifolius]
MVPRNATLQAISKKLPRKKEELLNIDGMGILKVNKYGDQILETIESIREQYNLDKTSSNSKKSSNSSKRSRNSNKGSNGSSNGSSKSKDEDDFMESTGRSKKRVTRLSNNNSDPICPIELDDVGEPIEVTDMYIDDEVLANIPDPCFSRNEDGRKLPWC